MMLATITLPLIPMFFACVAAPVWGWLMAQDASTDHPFIFGVLVPLAITLLAFLLVYGCTALGGQAPVITIQ